VSARFWAVSLSVLFALCSGAVADEFGRDGNLELWIRTEKPIYSAGEPIRVKVTLKNETTEALAVNRRFGFSQEIELELFKEPEGLENFRPPDKETPFRKEDFIVLRPGETLEKTIDLGERLSSPLKAGGYGIRAFYRNKEAGKKFGLSAWTGEIVSNRLSIQVRPAQRMGNPKKREG
jgi:hypothetical protein